MKLITLELQNFRQHVDTKVEFIDGVTAIVGRNGSGKTTMLEAIAWALYGAPAVRGNNEGIRTAGSAGGSKPMVTLTFELSGTVYTVTRRLDPSGKSGTAEMRVNNVPARAGMSEVSEAMAQLLGMDYRAFFTSFFTAQKELEFMANVQGQDRAAAIGRMLGYERLTKARDQVRDDLRALRNEIAGLEKGLADPEELRQRKSAAAAELERANVDLAASETVAAKAVSSLEKLTPVKEASEQKAARYSELNRRIELDQTELKGTQERISRLKAEQADLGAKRQEAEALRPDAEVFEQAEKEFRGLQELQKHESQRQKLTGQLETFGADIAKLEAEVGRLAGSKETLAEAMGRISEVEKEMAALDASIKALTGQRIAREQLLLAQIDGCRRQVSDVSRRRDEIAKAGEAGTCPTCERPLAGELHTVLASFDTQIAHVESQRADLERQQASPNAVSDQIKQAELQRQTLSAELVDLHAKRSDLDRKAHDAARCASELASRKQASERLARDLESLPKGFDQQRYQQLVEIAKKLKPAHKRYGDINVELAREPIILKDLAEAEQAAARKSEELAVSEKSIAELQFDQAVHDRLLKEYRELEAAYAAARLDVERRRGQAATAAARLQEVTREETAYKAKANQLAEAKKNRLYLDTLSQAMERFRADLNDRIRPELESTASEILSTLTDGRYNVLEIDDGYRAVIVDDGERKPVISGGEDDIVNLALRLAVSEMIADRAGQSMSLLVLDEVFGSLDETRRGNVVDLLQNLKNRFEQIIVITHVESMHDMVDSCVWVEFDEKTKTSRLVDRSRAAAETDTPAELPLL